MQTVNQRQRADRKRAMLKAVNKYLPTLEHWSRIDPYTLVEALNIVFDQTYRVNRKLQMTGVFHRLDKRILPKSEK